MKLLIDRKRKMRVVYFLIFFSCFTSGIAQKKWTFKDCVDYAIKNNIGIKQQELIVRNSEISINTSKLSRLPDLNMEIGNAFQFNKSENSSNANLGVNFSIPLFTGFKIPNQIQVDKYNLNASKENLKYTQEILKLNILTYFLDLLLKKEILKIYKEQEQLTLLQLEKTKKQIDVGKIPITQLLDIQSQVANDQLNVVMAMNNLDFSRLNLAQLINVDFNSEFDILPPEMDNMSLNHPNLSLTPQAINEKAVSIKPQIKESQYKLESNKKSVDVAKGDYLPNISLNIGYQTSILHQYGQKNDNFKNQFSNNGSEFINLTLSIPIFNRFATRNKVKQAKNAVTNSQLELEGVKQSLYKEIEQACQSISAAKSKLSVAKKALAASEISYNHTNSKFSTGKATIFELNEAKVRYTTASLELLQAQYELMFGLKIIDFYSGRGIDFF